LAFPTPRTVWVPSGPIRCRVHWAWRIRGTCHACGYGLAAWDAGGRRCAECGRRTNTEDARRVIEVFRGQGTRTLVRGASWVYLGLIAFAITTGLVLSGLPSFLFGVVAAVTLAIPYAAICMLTLACMYWVVTSAVATLPPRVVLCATLDAALVPEAWIGGLVAVFAGVATIAFVVAGW